eukprot:gene20980-27834_t
MPTDLIGGNTDVCGVAAGDAQQLHDLLKHSQDAKQPDPAPPQPESAPCVDKGLGQRDRAGEVQGDHDEAWYRGKKMRAVKRAARSELSVSKGEWKHGYAEDPSALSVEGIVDDVPRYHWKDLSVEEFVERFERPRLPVVITGLTEGWPADKGWEPEALAARFGEHKFKVGSDDDGYAVRLKFSWFLDYVHSHEHGSVDDSPLYVFDGSFSDRTGSKSLLSDYEVPPYFREDLFKLVGERRRPPYRWMVMGPARSGSGLHIDPLATSAWNALVKGHKRWALFPPGTPKELVLPKEPGLERESISWYTKIYPRTQLSSWNTAKPINIIQGPGETVYVPGGWWHAVLNLDFTVAVTQNYVSTSNFPDVWRHTRKGRPKMSLRWLHSLRFNRPDLAAIADDINARPKPAVLASSVATSRQLLLASDGRGAWRVGAYSDSNQAALQPGDERDMDHLLGQLKGMKKGKASQRKKKKVADAAEPKASPASRPQSASTMSPATPSTGGISVDKSPATPSTEGPKGFGAHLPPAVPSARSPANPSTGGPRGFGAHLPPVVPIAKSSFTPIAKSPAASSKGGPRGFGAHLPPAVKGLGPPSSYTSNVRDFDNPTSNASGRPPAAAPSGEGSARKPRPPKAITAGKGFAHEDAHIYRAPTSSSTSRPSSTKLVPAPSAKSNQKPLRLFLYSCDTIQTMKALEELNLSSRVEISMNIKMADAVLSAKLDGKGKHVKSGQGEKTAINADIPFFCVGRKMTKNNLLLALAPLLVGAGIQVDVGKKKNLPKDRPSAALLSEMRKSSEEAMARVLSERGQAAVIEAAAVADLPTGYQKVLEEAEAVVGAAEAMTEDAEAVTAAAA